MKQETSIQIRKRKALIVEDNVMNREFLAFVLENEFDILEAENGEVGLRILAENYRELSVVFLDVNMPVCNGYEFLERVRDDVLLSTVPVIVTTGTDSQEEEVKCLDLGASDFVSKPYNPKIVLGRARSIIKLHESVATLSAIEYDKVTGFYSMPAFSHHIDQLFARNPSEKYDLLVFDIHEFKLVNNVYGESVGNEVLSFISGSCSRRIPGAVITRQSDRIYVLHSSRFRMGEDEMKDFIHGMTRNAPVSALSLKCGCYTDIDTSLSAPQLCDCVQMAVNGIKFDFAKTLAYYDDSIRSISLRNQKMESDFETALKNNEFVIWYQPKVDVHSEKIIAAEALVRWIGKDGKMVSPGDFIPLFEQDGLIHQLDEYIFDNVCAFQRKRISEGKRVVPVSVNLSRSSVYYDGTIEKYTGMVRNHGVDISLLPIELTESAATESQRIIELAKELIREGFSLHMDDFGAGYSSLSTLGTIPFDAIKLDKSLIDQIGSRRGDSILRHIILIAQELGLKIVAEGVEDFSQLEFLRGTGCCMVQGYYYSAPKSQDVFEKMLDDDVILGKK